jgi:hypothetical protein
MDLRRSEKIRAIKLNAPFKKKVQTTAKNPFMTTNLRIFCY